MREQSFNNNNAVEQTALSSTEELPVADKHNHQLHEIILKKQKLIIYLSILYTGLVIGSIIYLIFLK